MKRLAAAGCAIALTLPVFAEEPAQQPASLLLNSSPRSALSQGYAFDSPVLLADQLIWGLAHGARLLALACARTGKGAAAEAWVTWQEREQTNILAVNRSLGRHYFGREEVSVDAMAAALGLKSALALPPEQLDPACATLAEALAQPRYDLTHRREEMLQK